MCLISSSEIQKRIIFKVHAPRHGLFLSSSNISAFCPAFPPPTHAGLSLDRHIAICSRQSFAGLIFYPSRTANTNFPLYVHQTPSLNPPVPPSARTSLSPALSFIHPERQTQTSPMHKQHFLYSFVPSPANGTTPFLPATPNILSKGSLLLSFSPSLLLSFSPSLLLSFSPSLLLSFSPSLLLSFSPSLLLSFSPSLLLSFSPSLLLSFSPSLLLSFSPSLLLSFSPSLLLPAAAFRSLFTSFYHKHLPADVCSLNSFKPQMPVSKTSPALRPTYVSSSAR